MSPETIFFAFFFRLIRNVHGYRMFLVEIEK